MRIAKHHAAPTISVDVRVSFTPEAIGDVSNGTLLKAAEFSRRETLVVARKLYELDQEIDARETQRRIGEIFLKQAFGDFHVLADGIEEFFGLLREPTWGSPSS